MTAFLWVMLLLISARPAAALEKVTLQLKWTHAFQFAGYYAAKEKGFYREAGLDVDILEATPRTDPVRSVVEGAAQYGVGTSSLLLERKAGKPVVVLAVVFQQSPYEIYASPNIRQLKDLAGRRLMLEPQSDELLAYLKKEGVPLDSVTVIPHSFDAEGLMQGKADAISGYVSNEPYTFHRERYPYQTFSPRSAGIDFYGDNLFTSEQELRGNPSRVRAFRSASVRGWQYAKEHRDEIIDLIIRKYSPQSSRDYLRFESDQMIPLLQPNLIEIGYMNPGRWRHIADTYADIGLLPADYPLDGFIYRDERLDMSWVYRWLGTAGAVIITLSIVALYIYRDKRRLARLLEERNRLEQQFLLAQKHESLGVMAGGIAHEFNNIMTAIIGNAEIALLKIPPDSSTAQRIRQIDQSAQRAAGIASRILAYAGKGMFYLESVDLNQLLEDMHCVIDAAVSKTVEVRFCLSDQLPPVEADANQMRQIVMNLAGNASDAIGTDQGAITIRTGLLKCDRGVLDSYIPGRGIAAGTYVNLIVSDTGCGMDRETLSKLFDPFFTTKFIGRGLGMAAVLGIIREHKGAIRVVSEPGKGSTFDILLPVSREDRTPHG